MVWKIKEVALCSIISSYIMYTYSLTPFYSANTTVRWKNTSNLNTLVLNLSETGRERESSKRKENFTQAYTLHITHIESVFHIISIDNIGFRRIQEYLKPLHSPFMTDF